MIWECVFEDGGVMCDGIVVGVCGGEGGEVFFGVCVWVGFDDDGVIVWERLSN